MTSLSSLSLENKDFEKLKHISDFKIESLSRHFEQQISLYGSQILINLVNQKGYEKPVKEAYERALEGLKNDRLKYVYFDFHHECKGLRFDRVAGLIDSLDQELLKQA